MVLLSQTAREVKAIDFCFSFFFVGFCFIISSCLFPTGFTSTSVLLAFLFACFILVRDWSSQNLGLLKFEKVGIFILGWLALSIFWSKAELVQCLEFLSEYRIFFITPIFGLVLTRRVNTFNFGVIAFFSGAVVAIFASFFLSLGLIEVEGANNSLANRIYHGFIVSLAVLFSLSQFHFQSRRVYKIVFLIIACLGCLSVIVIEDGRTGYMQIGAVALTYIVFFVPKKFWLMSAGAIVVVFAVSYSLNPKMATRLGESFVSLNKVVLGQENDSSIGRRIEFYRIALLIGFENYGMGAGIGDLADELSEKYTTGEIAFLTDNVHSEFLNLFGIGGFVAVFLYVYYLFTIVLSKNRDVRHDQYRIDFVLMGLALIILISSMWNSTIKDFGEKHALIACISILSAYIRARSVEGKGFGGSA